MRAEVSARSLERPRRFVLLTMLHSFDAHSPSITDIFDSSQACYTSRVKHERCTMPRTATVVIFLFDAFSSAGRDGHAPGGALFVDKCMRANVDSHRLLSFGHLLFSRFHAAEGSSDCRGWTSSDPTSHGLTIRHWKRNRR